MLKKACLRPGRPPAETRLFLFLQHRQTASGQQSRAARADRPGAAAQRCPAKSGTRALFRAPGHGDRAGMTAHASQAGRRGEPAGLLPGPGSPVPRRSSFSGSSEKQFIPNGPVSIRRSEGQRAAGLAAELRLPGSVRERGRPPPKLPRPSPAGQAKQNDKRPVRRCLSQRSCGQWGKTPFCCFTALGAGGAFPFSALFRPGKKPSSSQGSTVITASKDSVSSPNSFFSRSSAP